MASLKLLLGMIPSTKNIEQAEKALITEFEKLHTFSKSEQLAKYIELDKLVASSEFIQNRKEIESLNFNNSEEKRKEKEFLSLQKAKDIVLYYRTIARSELKKFKELDGSEKINSFEALEKEVKSLEFRQKIKAKEFKGSDDFKKFQEYKRLKESKEIQDYFKFRSSKEYSNYLNTDGSGRLARYNELKEYVGSADFKKQKEYLLDKKRFQKTEMFKKFQEYEILKKNEDILWYYKIKDSDKFDVLKRKELTFSEEFDGNSLDTNKWLTNYYWGEKLLKDRYSVESDLQTYTEKDNFDLRNSTLKINTKSQRIKGKVWSATNGFSTKEFSYTSGLINSGASFRQKYGVFSAKIKLGDPNSKCAFWMLADKIRPHINICRTSKGKVWFDLFSSNGSNFMTSIGSRYANDFYIYSLEWTHDKLVWKINNTVVSTQTTDIPQEPMYVQLAGGTDKPLSGMTSMEIDWIRVYKTL